MKTVALVTGASSGTGKEIAKQLIQDGLEVYVAARRTEAGAETKEVIQLGIRAEEREDSLAFGDQRMRLLVMGTVGTRRASSMNERSIGE